MTRALYFPEYQEVEHGQREADERGQARFRRRFNRCERCGTPNGPDHSRRCDWVQCPDCGVRLPAEGAWVTHYSTAHRTEWKFVDGLSALLLGGKR